MTDAATVQEYEAFVDALCSEFVALLEQEHRYDLLEAQYVVRACREQAEANTDWSVRDGR